MVVNIYAYLLNPISDDPDFRLFLASAEDIIVHKLYWYRLGEGVSDRQWEDVKGVRDLLERAMSETGQ